MRLEGRDKNVDEKTVADSLLKNIPAPADPVTPSVASTLVDEQSSVIQDAVSELALLKLGNELGVLRPDAATSERLKFIHDQLAAVSADTSHESMLATLKDLMTKLGLTFREDRFMRLYLWLKLNRERIEIETEMANVGR